MHVWECFHILCVRVEWNNYADDIKKVGIRCRAASVRDITRRQAVHLQGRDVDTSTESINAVQLLQVRTAPLWIIIMIIIIIIILLFIIIIIIIIIFLGRKISSASGDDREAFLFQRVSVLVQRYNAVLLLHDTLPATDCTDWWSVPIGA